MKRTILLIIALLLTGTTFSDVEVDPLLDCCTQNTIKLNSMQKNLMRVESNFQTVQESFKSVNTNLYQLKVGLSQLSNQKEERKCDYCGIIGSLLGAFLTGLIVIWVFVEGKRREKNKEINKLKDFGKEIHLLVKNIITNANKNVDQIKILIESIKEHPTKHGNYKKVLFNSFERVQSFDTTKIHDLFSLLEFEEEVYINFYGNIDFLTELFRLIDGDYNSTSSEVITPLTNKFLELKSDMLELCTDFLEEKRKENKTDDELFKFLDKLLIDYYKSENLPEGIDINYDNEHLIRIIRIGLLEKFRDWNITNKILKVAQKAGNEAKSIEINNLQFASDLQSQIDNIEGTINKIEGIEKLFSTKYPG